MSHRCKVCDWSPFADSIFHSSFEFNPRHLYLHEGEVYCNVCFDDIEALIQEDSDEELFLEYESLDNGETKEPSDEDTPTLP